MFKNRTCECWLPAKGKNFTIFGAYVKSIPSRFIPLLFAGGGESRIGKMEKSMNKFACFWFSGQEEN